MQRPARPSIHLLTGPAGWWGHQIREGLRLVEWNVVAKRREDCQGMDSAEGVDRDATCALLNSSSLAPQEKGMLRSIIAGSVKLGHRLWKAQPWSSPLCPCCGYEPETLQHCLWRCPCFDAERLDPDLPDYHERQQLPACTLECGVFLRCSDDIFYEHQLQPVVHARAMRSELTDQCATVETWNGDRIVTWTDCACERNQDRPVRRGGCGVFYGHGHARNHS